MNNRIQAGMQTLGVASLAAASSIASLNEIINSVAEQPKRHAIKVYHSAEGPMRSDKAKRPAGMTGRQWKKARKAAGISTKSTGFFRTKKEEEKASDEN